GRRGCAGVCVPQTLAARGVRRYGFHGLSYEYIASCLPERAPDIAGGRVVVAHLGNGASLCAMRAGQSVATTMGFRALDGLAIGSLAAALGGLDGIVFTASVGENAPSIRAAICDACAWLGVGLDRDANEAQSGRISRADSKVAVHVIPTDENLVIARHTRAAL